MCATRMRPLLLLQKDIPISNSRTTRTNTFIATLVQRTRTGKQATDDDLPVPLQTLSADEASARSCAKSVLRPPHLTPFEAAASIPLNHCHKTRPPDFFCFLHRPPPPRKSGTMMMMMMMAPRARARFHWKDAFQREDVRRIWR